MGEMYRSLSKRAFVTALRKLVPDLREDDIVRGGAGVRAQAVEPQRPPGATTSASSRRRAWCTC